MKLTERAIFVEDVDACARFYETLLGSPPVHRGEGIAVFHSDGMALLIHARCDPGPDDLPCEDHVAFGTKDVDVAVERLAAAGLTIEVPPRRYDWGYSAYLRDPAGNLIEIQRMRE